MQAAARPVSQSSQARQRLDEHVHGLIVRTHSVKDVRRQFDELEEYQGTAMGMPHRAFEGAKQVCKDALTYRLRDAAQSAVYAGGKQRDAHIKPFAECYSDAEDIGWLHDELDLPEFAQLLRNFQVRSDAGKMCRDDPHAAALIQQLEAHMKVPEQGMEALTLTDHTLASIVSSILRAMVQSPQACRRLVDLGIVRVVRRLFLHEGIDLKVTPPNPDFPELQMSLARVLAVVVLQSARESAACLPTPAELRMRAICAAEKSSSKQPPPPPTPPPISNEAKSAIRVLIEGLENGVRRNEHSVVWAVVSAFQCLVQEPFACKQLVEAGVLGKLRSARDMYQKLPTSGPLPLAAPRPRPREVAVTKEAPSFVGAVAMPPGLTKQRSSVHERYQEATRSASMPVLQQQPRRRSSGFLFADLPLSVSLPSTSSRLASKILRKRNGRMSPLAKVFANEVVESDLPALPPLMWLIGEDCVDREAFTRVCDRSLMLLRLRKLVRSMEEVQMQMGIGVDISPQLGSSGMGLMGNRPDSRPANASRGGLGSRSGVRSRGNQSTLPPPAKGSDMLRL